MAVQPNSLTTLDAWLIKRAFEGLRDPDHYPNTSPWLREFIHASANFTGPGWRDDLARLLGADGLRRVNQQNHFAPAPTAEQPTPYRLYTIDELRQLPPLTWLIESEIPAKGLTVLYGPSGAGKSFVALDYALTVSQHGSVLYYAGEGESGYGNRSEAWSAHHLKQPGPTLRFVLGTVPLLDPTWAMQFIDLCRNLRPVLVVVDTLARVMLGGDENSSRDMGTIIETCTRIVNEARTAVLIVHHTNKTGSSERGSSALRGAADSMIELSNDDGLITVECSKSKDARPFETRYLKLLEVVLDSGATSCVVVPANRSEVPATLTERAKSLIRALQLESIETGASARTLCTVTGIGERSVYRILSPLIRKGYVEHGKKGEPYKLTETGRALNADWH